MYRRAKNGEIKQFTGVDDVYEVPSKPNMIVDTEKTALQHVIGFILQFLYDSDCISPNTLRHKIEE
jgi:adenylylsulfate kinase-like enzyme